MKVKQFFEQLDGNSVARLRWVMRAMGGADGATLLECVDADAELPGTDAELVEKLKAAEKAVVDMRAQVNVLLDANDALRVALARCEAPAPESGRETDPAGYGAWR